MMGLYLSALIVVMFTLLNAVTETPFNVGLFMAVPLWAIIIAMFVVAQYSLSRIIITAKSKTLGEVQAKIEQLLAEPGLAKETRETVNWLLDYHDRIKATHNSALDLRAALGFLNSLLLPLLTFALTNLDKILALFH